MIEEDDLNPPFPYWWFITVAIAFAIFLVVLCMKG